MKNTYCVIMAGGIGSRFWPMSTEDCPKQFIDVLGVGKTLLQQTFERYLPVCPAENILIVTNKQYKDLVLKQLPGLSSDQILLEPHRRNTAPCIAYASYKILEKNPHANIIVAPADHLIINENKFIETIQLALKQASSSDCLVTLGIKPTRPDTGYGYIQFDASHGELHDSIRKVRTFTEKPDEALAKEFIESGEFYWNSGMFVWNVQSIMNAFAKYMPNTNNLFKGGIGKYNTKEEEDFIENIYPVCKNISIDYGVMEEAKNVYVVLSDFGWSDLGTWGSLYTHLDRDAKGNAVNGKKVMLYDSNNCIVRMPKNKIAVIQGLDDYIVVESDQVLLICKKQEEQKIKQFVNDLKVGKQ